MGLDVDFNNVVHKCTSIGCHAVFKTKNKASAHSQMHLHAKRTHNTYVSFACHRNCPYLEFE